MNKLSKFLFKRKSHAKKSFLKKLEDSTERRMKVEMLTPTPVTKDFSIRSTKNRESIKSEVHQESI